MLPTPSDTSTCLVTGASSGIGREFARALARRGLGVTLVARREERLSDLATELTKQCDVRAETVAADLVDHDSRRALVAEVAERDMTVDLVVNCAGFSAIGDFWKIDQQRQLDEVRLNSEALVDLTRSFLPGMVERDRGGIINVASLAAYYPMPFAAVYGATKAFVLSFSEALNDELKDTAVTVTAVSPNAVPTEGTDVDLNRIPNIIISSAEKVAMDAINAFDKGKRGVIPRFANKILLYSTRPLPTSVKLPFIRRIFGRT